MGPLAGRVSPTCPRSLTSHQERCPRVLRFHAQTATRLLADGLRLTKLYQIRTQSRLFAFIERVLLDPPLGLLAPPIDRGLDLVEASRLRRTRRVCGVECGPWVGVSPTGDALTSGKVVAMSAPTQRGAPQRPDEPMFLWNKVVKARRVVTSQRHLPVGRPSSIARAELLSALEAYALSLTNRGRPIPYALRDELRLTRLTQYG
jgi:hypothetical protein